MAKKLGLALGSGFARGWAHIGVLRALNEMNIKPDVIAGCSVGALVGGAALIGALEEFEAWARELKPLSALNAFSFGVGKGGLIDAGPAFAAFAGFDRAIEDLPVRYGAVAADLGTGEEVWITQGSIIEAARASSAVPVLFHAVQRGTRWLIDGAVANPTPVSLARYLGADVVVAVDLMAVPKVLTRFNAPLPDIPPEDETPLPVVADSFSGAVQSFIDATRRRVDRQMRIARHRQHSKPLLFETALAAADIFQLHLSRMRAEHAPPDIRVAPDMRAAAPNAFDRADEFIDLGRRAMLAEHDHLLRLLRR
jgi:NTE family protein